MTSTRESQMTCLGQSGNGTCSIHSFSISTHIARCCRSVTCDSYCLVLSPIIIINIIIHDIFNCKIVVYRRVSPKCFYLKFCSITFFVVVSNKIFRFDTEGSGGRVHLVQISHKRIKIQKLIFTKVASARQDFNFFFHLSNYKLLTMWTR